MVPRPWPAASRAIGSVLVSVIPGATLTSRKNAAPAETIRSVRDTSRSPSARWAVTAASAAAFDSAGVSRAGTWNSVCPGVYLAA